VTFYGRGYGHGVGLSQYGARGRALAGQTSAEILAAYFQGTTPATVNPARNVRVLLLKGFKATSTRPLTIYGRSGEWTIDGVAKRFPADAVLRVWRTTKVVNGVTVVKWRYRVLSSDLAVVLHSATASGSLVVRPAAVGTVLQLWSKPTIYDTFRGLLRVILRTGSANVVNHVPLDQYLRGVVPVEMPPSWPVAALEAQAVAARSYAVRRLHPSTGTFDLYDDTRSQVYRGMEAEKASTDAVIAASPGAILRSGSAVVNAFFHSTGGAATEDNEYAFVPSSGKVTSGPVSYLRGISDRAPDGTPYDAASPWYAWRTTTLTRAQVSAMFRTDSRTNVGDVLRLDLRKRGVSGRLYRVTLYGTTGTKTVSADVFRAVYNAARPQGAAMLRSNLFDVAPLP
jgi:stage II sporulation protein D